MLSSKYVSPNININIYEGHVQVRQFDYVKNKSFIHNILKLRKYLKEEDLPHLDQFSFLCNDKKINIEQNIDTFKNYLNENSEEVNIYFPIRNITYNVNICIIPIDEDPQEFNEKYCSDIIKIKINVLKYSFNSLLKEINTHLLNKLYNTVKDFHYMQEDGDISWMNKDLAKKDFEDVLYSLISNAPSPGYIIVNSDMN